MIWDSRFKDIVCGVPQGSILGPLLFILYADIGLIKTTKVLDFTLFADDTTLFCTCIIKLIVNLNYLSRFWYQGQCTLDEIWFILPLTFC